MDETKAISLINKLTTAIIMRQKQVNKLSFFYKAWDREVRRLTGETVYQLTHQSEKKDYSDICINYGFSCEAESECSENCFEPYLLDAEA